ncbi:hypothetical protein KC19_9G077100 [Ceratodon purpureus]|uniref:Uncharacterized protein n=1 Tax=Ceratodon purpureus TaxID=3225 RepID=A0A8T0GPS3_CERPU|nr:hypothetical protein KC19_9G077100 [Ceratodon purpureus]
MNSNHLPFAAFLALPGAGSKGSLEGGVHGPHWICVLPCRRERAGHPAPFGPCWPLCFEDHTDRDIVFVDHGHWSGRGCPAAGHELTTELLKPVKKLKEKKTPANPKSLMIKSSALIRDDEEYSS